MMDEAIAGLARAVIVNIPNVLCSTIKGNKSIDEEPQYRARISDPPVIL